MPASSAGSQDELSSATVSEADYSRLFDLALDLLCIAGLDGYFKKVNPAWTRALGWSEAELLARPVADFMHPEDRERTLQARSGLAAGVPVRGLENRYLCKDGSYRWLAWQSSIEPGETTVFGVARDITERRERDRQKLMLSKLESTGILAGGIAHDFNNFLSMILVNVEMTAVCSATTEQQKFYLNQAQQTVESAKALVQQLIAFAHSDGVIRRVVDLRNLLRHAMEGALQGSRLEAKMELALDLWPAEVDEAQMAQVIRNLVLNAREAMPEDGKVGLQASNISLKTDAGYELAPGDYVRISVIDEGSGIAAEVRPKIFDPYFSTKQPGAQKGMGLGLTISHAVLKKHGGGITVEPREGGGTMVTCHLPAAERN